MNMIRELEKIFVLQNQMEVIDVRQLIAIGEFGGYAVPQINLPVVLLVKSVEIIAQNFGRDVDEDNAGGIVL